MRFPVVINSNWHSISCHFGVITAYCSNFGRAFLCLPLGGGVRDNVRCSSWAHWKACSGLSISVNWTYFATCYGWGATGEIRSKIDALKASGSMAYVTNFRAEGDVPATRPPYIQCRPLQGGKKSSFHEPGLKKWQGRWRVKCKYWRVHYTADTIRRIRYEVSEMLGWHRSALWPPRSPAQWSAPAPSFSTTLAQRTASLNPICGSLRSVFRSAHILLTAGIAIPDLNFQSRDSGLSNSQSRDPGIPSGLADYCSDY